MIFWRKWSKSFFFSQILTFITSKLYSVCFEKFFEVHCMSVCQKLTMLKFVPHPSHFWVSATSRLLLKRLCNSGGWSRAQMKAYDLICLENLSFGIFRAPELIYQRGQYLEKPIWNRVNSYPKMTFKLDSFSMTLLWPYGALHCMYTCCNYSYVRSVLCLRAAAHFDGKLMCLGPLCWAHNIGELH